MARSIVPALLLAGAVSLTVAAFPAAAERPLDGLPRPQALETTEFRAPESPVPEADRAAILAMAGEFRVTFTFDETVVLLPGYERKQPHRSGAREIVLVEQDHGDRIVLQHILVSPAGHVTKHWRQDWLFEARERLEFVADQRWEVRPVDPARVPGSWTQCVFEVSDAPRYCGTGHWNHRCGNPTWTSDRTWRPLPRREHTKRSDYNALKATNRHTITPDGWTHEQDNTKAIRQPHAPAVPVVREVGFNDYRRTDAVDFSNARAYWEATRAFWADVREHWEHAAAGGGLELAMEVDGMPLIVALFELAAEVQQGRELHDVSAHLEEAFARWVRPLATE